jgi:hypothetical protein
MATKKRSAVSAAHAPAVGEVAAFLRDVDHPHRADLEAVRQTILSASPGIREGIKWNAPSFGTTDDFVTCHLRAKGCLQLIFHAGAKPRQLPTGGLRLDDPLGLVKWLAPDRCLVTLGVGEVLVPQRAALQALVVSWLRQVEGLPLAQAGVRASATKAKKQAPKR